MKRNRKGRPSSAGRAGANGLPAVTEKEFMDQVIRLARLRHWLCYHTHDSRRSQPGFPDLFLIRPATGEILFCELKSGRGRLTPDQEAWLEALRECGLPIRIWSPKDWTEIEETLS